MKKCMFSVFFFLFVLVLQAQDDSYTGPAKNAVKSFWDAAEKLEQSIAAGGTATDLERYASLARKVADIKMKDPAYNLTAIQTRIKAMKDKLDTINQKKEQSFQESNDAKQRIKKVDALLYSLYHDFSSGSVTYQQTEIFKSKASEVLAMDRTGSYELPKLLNSIKVTARNAGDDMIEIDRRCREQTDPKNSEVHYFTLLFKQAFWNTTQQLYPEETTFKELYTAASKLVNALGSIDDVHKLAEKSKTQKIRDTRMPEAAAKDAVLEKRFAELFNKDAASNNMTILKVVITGTDWKINRNELTGIILGRARAGVIAGKDKNGKCYLAKFDIYEDYVGSSFTGSRIGYWYYSGVEILCENVK
jgi:hypothetical protein